MECKNSQEAFLVFTDKDLNGSWESQYQEEHSVKRRDKKVIKIGELMKQDRNLVKYLRKKMKSRGCNKYKALGHGLRRLMIFEGWPCEMIMLIYTKDDGKII